MEEKYFEKQIGWYRMTSKHLSAGSIFIQAGQTLDCFWYVAEGTLQAEYSGGFITLEKGDILGLCDFNRDTHSLTYRATSECSVVP